MARQDYYHQAVRQALETDGWTITHEPLNVVFDQATLAVDFGAEKLILANKSNQKIAVEVKNFLDSSSSIMNEWEKAIGQYLTYTVGLEEADPERKLYLAISRDAYERFFTGELSERTLRKYSIHLLVFDPSTFTITSWKD